MKKVIYIVSLLLLMMVGWLWISHPGTTQTGSQRNFMTIDSLISQLQQKNYDAMVDMAIDYEALKGSSLNVKPQNFRSQFLHQEIAITFDLHDHLGDFDYILNLLKKYKIKSTFFLTGYFVKNFPNETKRLLAEGHEVGSHSLNHIYYNSKAKLIHDLVAFEKLFFQTTGKKIAPYWRSPYFQEDDRQRIWMVHVARDLGYVHFNATIDVKDWAPRGHPCFTDQHLFFKAFQRLRLGERTNRPLYAFCRRYVGMTARQDPALFDVRGAIVLFHAYTVRKSDNLVHQLENVIKYLHQKKYAVVSLSEVMNDRAIHP